MGKVYSIGLGENFLKTATEFLKNELDAKELRYYKAILPNNRSCRVFQKCFTWNIRSEENRNKDLVYLKTIPISEMVPYDVHKITIRISYILRKRNKNIPVSTVFELAQSVSGLIKDFILNNIEYSQLQNLVPNELMENWIHTIRMIDECVNDEEISKELQKARETVRKIAEPQDNLILIGISNNNYFTKNLFNSIKRSRNGLIFLNEDAESQNESYNRKIFGEIYCEPLKKEKKTVEQTPAPIKFAEFQNILEEAEGIGEVVEQFNGSVLIVAPDVDLSKCIKRALFRRNIIPDDSYGDMFEETSEGLLVNLILDAILNDFSTRSCLKIFKMVDSKNAMQMELSLRKERMIFPQFEESLRVFRDIAEQKNTDPTDIDADKIQEEENNNVSRGTILNEASTDKVSDDANASFAEFFQKAENFFDILKSEHIIDDRGVTSAYISKTFMEWSEVIKMLLKSLEAEEAYEKFEEILAEYSGYSESFDKIHFGEYAIFLKKHCMKKAMRCAEGYTKGIVILGSIEAQILDADLVILAGANEKNFTSVGQEDFWLSDSMKKSLGIPTTESKNKFRMCIFERLANKNNVLITRSKNIEGEQQVAYGFLDQINKKRGKEEESLISDNYIINKKAKSKHQNIPKTLAMGNPPIEHRRLAVFSVSDIAHLQKNPYIFYAEKILKLEELDKIDEIKNLRGKYVHKVLENYTKKKYGNDIYISAKMTLKEMKVTENSFGLWYFLLNDILDFVKENKNEEILCSLSELWAKRNLVLESNSADKNISSQTWNSNSANCQSFEIKCRMDRVDLLRDKKISIIDYKTFKSKISKKSVQKAEELQLLLEAWIAKDAGFCFYPNEAHSIQYLFLTKERGTLVISSPELDVCIEKALEKVKQLLHKYNILGAPYEVNPDYKFGEGYMHLARVKEWKKQTN